MSTKRSAAMAAGLARLTSSPDDDFSVSAEPDMKRPRTITVQRSVLRHTLTQHESKHTVDDNEKPYACDQCNYRSKAVANLRVPLPLPNTISRVCLFFFFYFGVWFDGGFLYPFIYLQTRSWSRTPRVPIPALVCIFVHKFLFSCLPLSLLLFLLLLLFCVFPGPCAHTSYRRAPIRM
jgi:hypothetical protein